MSTVNRIKKIETMSTDVLDRAAMYRRHEDQCKSCREARNALHPRDLRCERGRILWTLIWNGSEMNGARSHDITYELGYHDWMEQDLH